MNAMNPDLIVCQEFYDSGHPGAGRDSFLTNVLNVNQPGQWGGQYLDVGSGEGMGVFWKRAVVETTFNYSGIATGGPRTVFLFGVRIKGYPNSTFFRIYAMHLKAGNTAPDSSDLSASGTTSPSSKIIFCPRP